jgi:hypothetical protein
MNGGGDGWESGDTTQECVRVRWVAVVEQRGIFIVLRIFHSFAVHQPCMPSEPDPF